MDIFYIVVSSIAIIVLILILTVIGLMMKYQNHVDEYPPYQSQCPDYWVTLPGGNCAQPANGAINALADNYNPLSTSKPDPTLTKNVVIAGGPRGPFSYNFSANSVCDNKKWAARNKIEWDGVSNSIAPC